MQHILQKNTSEFSVSTKKCNTFCKKHIRIFGQYNKMQHILQKNTSELSVSTKNATHFTKNTSEFSVSTKNATHYAKNTSEFFVSTKNATHFAKNASEFSVSTKNATHLAQRNTSGFWPVQTAQHILHKKHVRNLCQYQKCNTFATTKFIWLLDRYNQYKTFCTKKAHPKIRSVPKMQHI